MKLFPYFCYLLISSLLFGHFYIIYHYITKTSREHLKEKSDQEMNIVTDQVILQLRQTRGEGEGVRGDGREAGAGGWRERWMSGI